MTATITRTLTEVTCWPTDNVICRFDDGSTVVLDKADIRRAVVGDFPMIGGELVDAGLSQWATDDLRGLRASLSDLLARCRAEGYDDGYLAFTIAQVDRLDGILGWSAP